METPVKYKVLANRNGQLSVAGMETTLRPGDVVIASNFDTGDQAFDYLEELQARIDTINRQHCRTCE